MRTLLLFVLGVLLLSSALCSSVNGPRDCCFNVYLRRIQKERVKNYTVTDERCAKAGVIFVTQNSRFICVDPNMGWVQNVIKYLDEKSF